ncbi:TetR/AcrR family transcriptional regulator [Herbidospora sp. NBRC 101105]|uniref:TetR/AcrR family transcriptional regulator n=1 Tax=Herbidospora sp. NBRC 101105 TaxID=3032195 RepID=UPI0024A4C678|nr:TetR/AcrR family transcriptional regulator [Herbidospora sp. NBRC 101105]GLX93094.1 TetR family transcriptional regulator [Herbidospora sp. NBRC 101105]
MVTDVPDPAAPESLRKDQRERRARIVRTGLRALAGSDYDRIKVSDVARDAEVALGTLYRYFSSKEHLFAAVFDEWQDGLRRRLGRLPLEGDTPEDRLRSVVHAAIRAFQTQPQFYRLMIVLQTTDDPRAAEVYTPLDTLFADVMRTAVDGVDETVVSTLRAVADQGLRAWIRGRLPIEAVYQGVDDTLGLIYR